MEKGNYSVKSMLRTGIDLTNETEKNESIESIEIPAPDENVGRIDYSSNVEKYVRYFVM